MAELAVLQQDLQAKMAVRTQYDQGKELHAKGKKDADVLPVSWDRAGNAYAAYVHAMSGSMTAISESTVLAAAQITQESKDLDAFRKTVDGIQGDLGKIDSGSGYNAMAQQMELSTRLNIIQATANGIEMQQSRNGQINLAHPASLMMVEAKMGGTQNDFLSQLARK